MVAGGRQNSEYCSYSKFAPPDNHELHSTPKESIHFEFRWVSTQSLHHVGPVRGYGG